MLKEDYCFTREQVHEMQSKLFEEKVLITQSKILQIINLTGGGIYVAFSGGKDSSVVLDITASIWKSVYPNKPLVVAFANTKAEFSGMIDFIKSYVKYIEKKHGIKIDFHMTQPDIKFKEMFEQIGYPVASKEVAEYVRSIREKMIKLGITFDDIKEHLTPTIENAEYLRELGFSDYQVKRVCRIDKNNKEVNTFVIPYRWQPLLKAPFKVSGLCCSYLKKKPQKELSEKLGGVISGIRRNGRRKR